MNSRQKARMKLARIPYYITSIIELMSRSTLRSFIRCLFPLSRQRIIETKDGLAFNIKTLLDLLVFKEVVLDETYQKPVVGVRVHDKVIVDIGAGYGDFSILYAKRFPQSKIYAFEPDDVYYALLLDNIKLNAVQNVFPLKKAVGSFQEMYESIRELKIGFLKIDCEGCEFELFQKATRSQLERIHQCSMEYHEFTGRNIQTIVHKLKQAKYVVYVYPQKEVGDIGMLYAKRK